MRYISTRYFQHCLLPTLPTLLSAVSMRRECERWNMVILVLLFFQLLEAWVPPPLWLTNAWPSSYPVAKWKSPYCRVMSWLRCRLGFSLLHSAIMCIRGSCSSSGHPFKGHVPASVDLALGEGRLGAV